MPTCKNCGRTWNFEYSPDLCGAFCDGVWGQKLKVSARDAEIERLTHELDEAREAARFVWDATSPGNGHAFYAQCAIEKWPWLEKPVDTTPRK
jgi:hypothetical protein